MTKELETTLAILRADRAIYEKRGFSLHEVDNEIAKIVKQLTSSKIKEFVIMENARRAPAQEQIKINSCIRIQDLIRLIAKGRHDKKKTSHYVAELKELRIRQMGQENILRYDRERAMTADELKARELREAQGAQNARPYGGFRAASQAQREQNRVVTNMMNNIASGDFIKPTAWQKIKTFFGWH